MAQKDQEQIFQRAPHVDLVVGPGQLAQLPALLDRIAAGGGPQIEVSLDRKAGKPDRDPGELRSLRSRSGPPRRRPATRPWCGSCSAATSSARYCIVPSVRGPEQSRPAEEIEAEVRQLADQGCLEVTLLGQTVNSYQAVSGGRTVRLADLLGPAGRVDGPAAAEVRHQLPAPHDPRPAAGGPRPAQAFRPICTCRPKAARIACWGG